MKVNMKPIKIGNSYYLNIPNKAVKNIMTTKSLGDIINENFIFNHDEKSFVYRHADYKNTHVEFITEQLDIIYEDARKSVDLYHDNLLSEDKSVAEKSAKDLCDWLEEFDVSWDRKYVSFKQHLCGRHAEHYDELIKVAVENLTYNGRADC
jgi:capsid protein